MSCKIWSYIDLFQSPLTLYLQGSDRRTSTIGVIFSLMIYAYLLYSFVNSDLFQKSSPIVVNQSIQVPHASRISFNNNTLISVGICDAYNGRYQDESIFNIQFRFMINTTQLRVKNLRPCTVEDMSFNETLLKTFRLDGMYCLEDKNFHLEGNWDEAQLTYVIINLYQCDNKTSKGKCQSQEIINSYFQNPLIPKFFTVFIHNAQINMNNYENPFQISYRTEYQTIDPSLRKREEIKLNNAYVDTDDGVIFPTSNIVSNFMFNSKQFYFVSRQTPVDPFAQFMIFAAQEEAICTRRYQKLPEILGSLVGMMQLIMLFSYFAPYCIIYITTIEEFLNSLYIFPETENTNAKTKTEGNKQIIQNKKVIPSRSKVVTSNINEAGLKTKCTLEPVSRDNSTRVNRFKSLMRSSHLIFKSLFNLKSRTNKLTLSFREYVEYLLNVFFHRKKTKKMKLIQQAEKTFSYDLDIVNLIKKVHDLEKLKLILLNEEQLILFDHLSRPMIPFEQTETKIGNFINSYTQKSIRDVYQKMKTNENRNEVDSKLTKLFEQKPSLLKHLQLN